METDTGAVLLFRPNAAAATIEVRVGERVLRRFGITKGLAGVALSLPPEDLFVMDA